MFAVVFTVHTVAPDRLCVFTLFDERVLDVINFVEEGLGLLVIPDFGVESVQREELVGLLAQPDLQSAAQPRCHLGFISDAFFNVFEALWPTADNDHLLALELHVCQVVGDAQSHHSLELVFMRVFDGHRLAERARSDVQPRCGHFEDIS